MWNVEAALQIVVNDLIVSFDKGNMSILALLDLPSAFDTINISILV